MMNPQASIDLYSHISSSPLFILFSSLVRSSMGNAFAKFWSRMFGKKGKLQSSLRQSKNFSLYFSLLHSHVRVFVARNLVCSNSLALSNNSHEIVSFSTPHNKQKCVSSWLVSMPPVRPPFCTSSSSVMS